MTIRNTEIFPHVAGSIYKLSLGKLFILAIVEGNAVGGDERWNKLALISLNDGNRWCEPVKVPFTPGGRPPGALTDAEFYYAAGGAEFTRIAGASLKLELPQSS